MFNLRGLDLNLLTVFEAIYEIGTVSGAADRLALSQSAASHALARLRDACKDDLFVRVHQGFSPTPAVTWTPISLHSEVESWVAATPSVALFLCSVGCRFSVPAIFIAAIARSLGQAWPQATGEAGAQRD